MLPLALQSARDVEFGEGWQRRGDPIVMRPMHKTRYLWLASVVLVACSPTMLSNPDAGGDSSADRTTPADVRNDSTAPPDASDSGVADDVARDTGVDAPDPVDSGADGGVATDSGVVTDSGVAVDSGVAADSGVETDSGVVSDSGIDSGASPDGSSDDASADAASDASADGGASEGGTGLGGYTLVRNATGASCDTSSAWTNTGISDDDDVMAAPAPIGFNVGYFGGVATHFSANTNGLIQLWPSSTGTPTDDYRNGALPDPAGPEGAVAVFWDDLYVPPTAVVQYATFGTSPNRRFVVEYNNVDTIDEEQVLRFQAKLFEGTNVIEFHYCSMTTIGVDDRHTGESATIGVQSFSGSAGLEISRDTAGATPSGTWFRLVPR